MPGRPPPVRGWRTHAATLALFALIFATLEAVALRRESATWDEPVHVMDGYLSVTRGDFRADVEHPPLMRMWSALPLLTRPVVVDTTRIDSETSLGWALNELFISAHRFMYVDNDADALLYRARLMTVVLGIVLGGLLYAWSVALFGWAIAVVVLALFVMEPNLASHARLVTTDLAVTLTITGGVYFCWRLAQRWSWANAAGLVLCTVASVLVKYSGVLLAPMVVLWAIVALARRQIAPRQAIVLAVVAPVAVFAAIWTCYGFRYLPSATPSWRYRVHLEPDVREALPTAAAVTAWIDDHHILPNAYSEGLLLNQARSQRRKAFLAGDYRETGWWYYFPAAFAVKTPLGLIVLATAGAGVLLARRRTLIPYLLAPIAIVMAAGMTASINIGVRHVLPVYPFVLLLAGSALHAARQAGGAHLAAAAVAAAAALIEPGFVYPYTLAFFNRAVGGPARGSEYLVDSNLDWGQDLKALKRWMDQNKVERINLGYFGFADPAYYGIRYTPLAGSRNWTDSRPQAPQLPGYVAVSATLLRGVYEDDTQRADYARLAQLTPAATIGYSIFVFKVDGPW